MAVPVINISSLKEHQVYISAIVIYISKRLSEVINQTGPDGKDPQMVNLYNAARVIKVFAFHRSYRSLWRYSHILKPIRRMMKGIFYPVFDSQQEYISGYA